MTAVLGGGIGGLAAGYYLLRSAGQAANTITIYEACSRVGGWIRTERHKDKGFIFEAGPNTIRPKGIAGANTLEMIDTLNLQLDVIPSNHDAARKRMIYAKKQLCMLPANVGGALKTFPPFTKPLSFALFRDLTAARKKLKNADESIYDFTERRFGKEIADYAISPMICGICAGDAKEISVRFLLEDFFEKEQRYGGVIKGTLFSLFRRKDKTKGSGESKSTGLFANATPRLYNVARSEKWSMYRPKGGLDMLPRTLSEHLRDNQVNMQLGSDVREIYFKKNNVVHMNIRGREVQADHVVSALPAYQLASCVKDQHPSLGALLSAIPYVDVAVVNLQYNTEDLIKTNAFGFLVPPKEQLPILGVIFNSCCFDMSGNTVLTVMMGGKWFEQNFGKDPSQKELRDTALQHLGNILGIKQEPKMVRVNILNQCIPQYVVGHKQRVNDIRRYIREYNLPLKICGAAYDGVGINDVILSARQQVEAMK